MYKDIQVNKRDHMNGKDKVHSSSEKKETIQKPIFKYVVSEG